MKIFLVETDSTSNQRRKINATPNTVQCEKIFIKSSVINFMHFRNFTVERLSTRQKDIFIWVMKELGFLLATFLLRLTVPTKPEREELDNCRNINNDSDKTRGSV